MKRRSGRGASPPSTRMQQAIKRVENLEARSHKPTSTRLDTTAAKADLEALFHRIDALMNNDGFASAEELKQVFGGWAEDFLSHCDANKDAKLDKHEFSGGILLQCQGIDQQEFDNNWLRRLESEVAAAEAAGAGSALSKPRKSGWRLWESGRSPRSADREAKELQIEDQTRVKHHL